MCTGFPWLQCVGFSLWWLLRFRARALGPSGSNSCSTGSWAQLLRSMWDLHGPGIEPTPPALAGGFLTAGPSGKSGSTVLTTRLPGKSPTWDSDKDYVDSIDWFGVF